MATSLREKAKVVATMIAFSAGFTAVMATVEAFTPAGIQRNAELREVKGVLEALGVSCRGMKPDAVAQLAGRRLKKDKRGGLDYYRGLDEQGGLKAYVFAVGGAGFWGPVSGYVAIDPSLGHVVGIQFVRHSETPGLGARITEDWFRQQLIGKPISPPAGQDAAIRLVAEGKPKGPQDVDAITGATGTSRAVQRFLNDGFAAIRRAMQSTP